jgi:hypothetical protein
MLWLSCDAVALAAESRSQVVIQSGLRFLVDYVDQQQHIMMQFNPFACLLLKCKALHQHLSNGCYAQHDHSGLVQVKVTRHALQITDQLQVS